jgi:TRAP-type C4-dicarboxylate transport system substrate-binding protein
MTDDIPADLRKRLAEAAQELAEAQHELTTTLEDLASRERADKTMISHVLRDVLDKVTAAKRKLAAIDP